MSTLGTSALTLVDWAKRVNADDKIAQIVEVLNKSNEIIGDMAWVEGNLPTGHKTTVRSGIPSATWRLMNYGVQPSKSTTVQVTDACGMLETYSQVDAALVNLAGDKAEFRASEDRAFLEGMNQTFATALMKGNSSVNPEKIMGFMPRFSDATNAENKGNILKGGGTGSDNTSIWLVVWSDQTVHGIFPKGSKAGLSVEDLGQQTIILSDGSMYEGYRTHFKWDCGLCVRDWRYVVRIANISNAALTKTGSTGADLVDLITQAIELVPNINMGRPALYCNRTIKSFLRRQVVNKTNVHLTLDQVAGNHVLSFDGIPVRRVDAIGIDETTVS